jgi:hypothetical protein
LRQSLLLGSFIATETNRRQSIANQSKGGMTPLEGKHAIIPNRKGAGENS